MSINKLNAYRASSSNLRGLATFNVRGTWSKLNSPCRLTESDSVYVCCSTSDSRNFMACVRTPKQKKNLNKFSLVTLVRNLQADMFHHK